MATTIEYHEEQDLFEKLKDVLHSSKQRLTDSPTAQPLIQYLQIVDILFELYRGERTGDIEVSIAAGKHILPYLAAGNNFRS